MAENYIDYEVVEASAQSYSQQAEALGALLQALAGTNGLEPLSRSCPAQVLADA